MIGWIVYYLVIGLPILFVVLCAVLMIRRLLPESFPVGWVRFFAILIAFVYIAALLHYTLPQRDIVRITETDVIRMDFSGNNRVFYAQADSGGTERTNRDLRLINTVDRNGKVRVYRNEDTGFGWPFYFKFDSSNLQAEGADMVSNKAEPRWVVVRHYGWRNVLLSIYPNAVSMTEIDDPNKRLIPWFNIVFFVILGLLLLGLYRLVTGFRRRRIDPVVENIDEAWDEVSDKSQSFGDRIRGAFRRLGGG